jgi:hypothetical protein
MNMKANNETPIPAGTSTLFRRIFKAADLRSYLDENEKSLVAPTFTESLELLCQEQNMVREHVICRAGIERGFGHQLFRGSRKPSRDNVLRLAFGSGWTWMKHSAFACRAKNTALSAYQAGRRDYLRLAHHNTISRYKPSLSDFG